MLVKLYLALFDSTLTAASAATLPCFSVTLLSFNKNLASPVLNVVPLTVVGWYRFTLTVSPALATARVTAEISRITRLVILSLLELINTVQLFNVVDDAKVRPDAGKFVTSGKRGGKKLRPRPLTPDGGRRTG